MLFLPKQKNIVQDDDDNFDLVYTQNVGHLDIQNTVYVKKKHEKSTEKVWTLTKKRP